MNVDPQVLAACSAKVHTASEQLVDAHDGNAAAIGLALEGWVGLSRAAMSDTAARWADATVAVAAAMADHARALAVTGQAFAAMDIRHAAHLAAVRATETPCD
jgi:uncharacterized protein YukE